MIVHLDTSILVDAFSKPFRSQRALRALIVTEHRSAISTPVLYEWLRGPRLETEKADLKAFEVSKTSSMPPATKVLSPDEIADVVAYLLSLSGM